MMTEFYEEPIKKPKSLGWDYQNIQKQHYILIADFIVNT